MAQDPFSHSPNQEEEEEEEERGREVATTSTSNTSSKSWLQLGTTSSPPPPQIVRREGLTALELFPDKPSSSSPDPIGIAPVLLRANWNRILPIPAPPPPVTAADFRAVVPPPRSRAGVWFLLQASQNQGKEPFLPQVPKSYLRIKDGKITVRLLIKYLVNKLGLEDESEVEITCRGRRLLPFLTLQHVRDNIWCSREVLSSVRQSLIVDHHVMTLHYGRTA